MSKAYIWFDILFKQTNAMHVNDQDLTYLIKTIDGTYFDRSTKWCLESYRRINWKHIKINS